MNFLIIMPYYIVWHYGQALSDIRGIWKNFLVFIFHLFSIPVLFSTLFSPWQRIVNDPNAVTAVSSFADTLIVNTIMRVFGACIRLVTILIGFMCLAAMFVTGIIVFMFWLVLPALLLMGVVWGFGHLFLNVG